MVFGDPVLGRKKDHENKDAQSARFFLPKDEARKRSLKRELERRKSLSWLGPILTFLVAVYFILKDAPAPIFFRLQNRTWAVVVALVIALLYFGTTHLALRWQLKQWPKMEQGEGVSRRKWRRCEWVTGQLFSALVVILLFVSISQVLGFGRSSIQGGSTPIPFHLPSLAKLDPVEEAQISGAVQQWHDIGMGTEIALNQSAASAELTENPLVDGQGQVVSKDPILYVAGYVFPGSKGAESLKSTMLSQLESSRDNLPPDETVEEALSQDGSVTPDGAKIYVERRFQKTAQVQRWYILMHKDRGVLSVSYQGEATQEELIQAMEDCLKTLLSEK